MIPLQSLLALGSLKAYIKYLPLALTVLCGVVLLIAFFIGLKKGGRRVSWGGLVWLVAGVAFFLVDKYFGAKNPVGSWLSNKGFKENTVAFASSLTIAIACILVVLMLYGLCALIFRRRRKIKAKKDLSYERGVKYGTYEDVDVYGDEEDGTAHGRCLKPTVFGRLCGGVICVINTAMVLATLIATALLLVDSTSLKNGVLAPIYSVPAVNIVLKYAARFALDFAIIGIVTGIACKGTKTGMVESIRVILVKLGGVAVLVLGFYLPFSRFSGSNTFLRVVVERCCALFTGFGASEKVATIGGKVLSGVLLCVLAGLALWLVNLLFKQIVKGIRRVKFFRSIDGALSCLVYIVIGIAVCALLWAIVYALGYYGVFNAGGLMTSDTCLSNGIFETLDIYVKPYLERFTNLAKGWMAKIPF